ncbi:MAG: NAD-dependent epimerase/dehydratase family protein [Geminicoccaceae bacterium]
MSRILVTGGCGFIGSHLVERLLKDGNEVRILDDLSTGKRKNIPADVDVTLGCITDPDVVRQATVEVDAIFHLAAIASVERSNQAWAETHRINLTGTVNVFEAARHDTSSPRPVVYASSAAVYGDSNAALLSEVDDAMPLTAYGADKYACELHGRVASLVHNVPNAGLRFFNVYGPRQDPRSPYSGVISIFTEKALAGQSIQIFGDGEQSRDFIYVADITRALTSAMQAIDQAPITYPLVANACTGSTTTINELARLVMRAGRQRVPVSLVEARRGDIQRSTGDPEFARKILGFEAEWPLIDGLDKLIEHLRTDRAEAA